MASKLMIQLSDTNHALECTIADATRIATRIAVCYSIEHHLMPKNTGNGYNSGLALRAYSIVVAYREELWQIFRISLSPGQEVKMESI